MNLTPMIDQPNGFQVSGWPQDEAETPYGPLARVLSGKTYNNILALEKKWVNRNLDVIVVFSL